MAPPLSDVRRVLRQTGMGLYRRIQYLRDVRRLGKGLRDKRARFFGFDVEAFSAESLQHLLTENFVQFSYYMALAGTSPVIVDVGSNIGIATMFFKRFFPGSRIYCFEPDPDTFSALERNVARNDLRDVVCINAALSDYDGSAMLHVPPWSDGSSSLFPEKVDLERGFASRHRPDTGAETVLKDVRVLRGSDFLRDHKITSIDLLKIDAEGAEETIVKDMADMLPHTGCVVLEFHYARAFTARNSLARIVGVFEKAQFVVSVKPTWFTGEPQVMCTCIVRAVNGRNAALLQGGPGVLTHL